MQWLREHLFVSFLIALAITLVLLGSLFRLIAKDKISPELVLEGNNEYVLGNVTTSFSEPDVPSEVYSYLIQSIPTARDAIESIAQNLNYRPSQNITNFWFSPDETYYMHLDPENKIIIGLSQTSPENLPYTPDQLTTSASQLFEQFNFFNLSNFGEAQPMLIAELKEDLVSNPQQANIFRYHASTELDGIPVRTSTYRSYPFEMYLEPDGTLNSIELYPFPNEFSQAEPIETVSSETAVERLQRGQGLLTLADEEGVPFEGTTSDFTSANLTTAKFEYRIKENTSLALPYYIFSGTAVGKNRATYNVEFVVPAFVIE